MATPFPTIPKAMLSRITPTSSGTQRQTSSSSTPTGNFDSTDIFSTPTSEMSTSSTMTTIIQSLSSVLGSSDHGSIQWSITKESSSFLSPTSSVVTGVQTPKPDQASGHAKSKNISRTLAPILVLLLVLVLCIIAARKRSIFSSKPDPLMHIDPLRVHTMADTQTSIGSQFGNVFRRISRKRLPSTPENQELRQQQQHLATPEPFQYGKSLPQTPPPLTLGEPSCFTHC